MIKFKDAVIMIMKRRSSGLCNALFVLRDIGRITEEFYAQATTHIADSCTPYGNVWHPFIPKFTSHAKVSDANIHTHLYAVSVDAKVYTPTWFESYKHLVPEVKELRSKCLDELTSMYYAYMESQYD